MSATIDWRLKLFQDELLALGSVRIFQGRYGISPVISPELRNKLYVEIETLNDDGEPTGISASALTLTEAVDALTEKLALNESEKN